MVANGERQGRHMACLVLSQIHVQDPRGFRVRVRMIQKISQKHVCVYICAAELTLHNTHTHTQ